MPWKLSPGTPSMLAGNTIPCQWIDAVSSSELATRSVTVSPSFHRNVGAGTDPFTVNATRGFPVTFIGVSPMRKSKSVPAISFHDVAALPPCAKARIPQTPALMPTPAMPRPFTNVRRDTCRSVSCSNRKRDDPISLNPDVPVVDHTPVWRSTGRQSAFNQPGGRDLLAQMWRFGRRDQTRRTSGVVVRGAMPGGLASSNVGALKGRELNDVWPAESANTIAAAFSSTRSGAVEAI